MKAWVASLLCPEPEEAAPVPAGQTPAHMLSRFRSSWASAFHSQDIRIRKGLKSICSGTTVHVLEIWTQRRLENVPKTPSESNGTGDHHSAVNSLLLPRFKFITLFTIPSRPLAKENNRKSQNEVKQSWCRTKVSLFFKICLY